MIAALKDAPATEFRIPPGLRMYRVNPATGLPAGAGEAAIYEAYKPGTEPGKDRDRGLQRVPGEDETPMPRQQLDVPGAVRPPVREAPGERHRRAVLSRRNLPFR